MTDAFAPSPSHPSTAPLFASAALLDAEKFDCCRIALEFQAIAVQLVPKRGCAELRDQLDRASISIVLNTAVASYSVTLFDQFWRSATSITEDHVDQLPIDSAAVLSMLSS